MLASIRAGLERELRSWRKAIFSVLNQGMTLTFSSLIKSKFLAFRVNVAFPPLRKNRLLIPADIVRPNCF